MTDEEKAEWAQAKIDRDDILAARVLGHFLVIEGFNYADAPDYEGDEDNVPLAPTDPWIVQQLGFDPAELVEDLEDDVPEKGAAA